MRYNMILPINYRIWYKSRGKVAVVHTNRAGVYGVPGG